MRKCGLIVVVQLPKITQACKKNKSSEFLYYPVYCCGFQSSNFGWDIKYAKNAYLLLNELFFGDQLIPQHRNCTTVALPLFQPFIQPSNLSSVIFICFFGR